MYKDLKNLASELSLAGLHSYADKIISIANDEEEGSDSQEDSLCGETTGNIASNEAIDAAWRMLCPLLPAGSRITSGVRTEAWRVQEVLDTYRGRRMALWDLEFDEALEGQDESFVDNMNRLKPELRQAEINAAWAVPYSESMCDDINKAERRLSRSTGYRAGRGIGCEPNGNHTRGMTIDISGSDLDAMVPFVNKLIRGSGTEVPSLIEHVELKPWGRYRGCPHPEPHAPSGTANPSLHEGCTSRPHLHIGIVKASFDDAAEAALKAYLCETEQRFCETTELAIEYGADEEVGPCADSNVEKIIDANGAIYAYDEETEMYIVCRHGSRPEPNVVLPADADQSVETEDGTYEYDPETETWILK